MMATYTIQGSEVSAHNSINGEFSYFGQQYRIHVSIYDALGIKKKKESIWPQMSPRSIYSEVDN